MARYYNPTTDEEHAWREWVADLPVDVRVIAERFDPWTLYQLKTTGQRVVLYSFSEDGTVTVNVLAEFNLIMLERQVFGINPDDLEECDLPDADEISTVLKKGTWRISG